MTSSFSEQSFAFLMYPGFEELDLIGPWEMATMWSAYADGPACFTLSQTGEPITCAKGLKVMPDYSFATAPDFDYLMVPGGFAALEEMKNQAMNDFLADAASRAESVLSVCTGSLMLYAAGLLNGKKATTHWKMLPEMKTFDGVEVVEQRYVHDGAIWTSAGVSAGIDMTLAFVADMAGEAAASIVQHNAEYYPDPVRYGGEAAADTSPAYVRALVAAE